MTCWKAYHLFTVKTYILLYSLTRGMAWRHQLGRRQKKKFGTSLWILIKIWRNLANGWHSICCQFRGWTVSGAEEMLLHVAIRSADRIIRLHLTIGTFNTCTAPTGMLEMTTGGFKIITFRLLFTRCDLNYANTDCFFCCSLQVPPSQAGHVLPFLGKIFIVSVL